jgi:hypothetical protein
MLVIDIHLKSGDPKKTLMDHVQESAIPSKYRIQDLHGRKHYAQVRGWE